MKMAEIEPSVLVSDAMRVWVLRGSIGVPAATSPEEIEDFGEMSVNGTEPVAPILVTET